MHGTIESIFRVEWQPLAMLGSITAEWRALAERALEPNVFYEPAFARAAEPLFGHGVGAGLVWSRATPARLLGFFPARIESRRYGIPLPVLVGWTHPYGPLGMPLVDRDAGERVIAAWLEHVAGCRQLPSLLLLPYVACDGALAHTFDAAIARRGGWSRSFARHARALLAPGDNRDDYFDQAVGRKKRKELRRQRKRLADTGVLMSDSTSEPSATAHALDDFLALEAAGWKGRAGTAARTDSDTRNFLAAAVAGLASGGKARIHRLLLDGRPIAAIVMLRSGATEWCWKIAYDEGFARYSPGVQLLVDVTRGVLDDRSVVRADSCATKNHPMIDHIWRERLVLADRLIALGPDGAVVFGLACALEASRRMTLGAAKTLRDLLRR